jgi:transcriptional regulator with XRE-family HTH domain
MIELGQTIRKARKEKRLTQAELAAAAGIARMTLSQIENGTIQDIGIRKVMRLLEYLGLELAVRPAGAPPTLEELRKEG